MCNYFFSIFKINSGIKNFEEAGPWWCTGTPSTFGKLLIASPNPKTHDFWNSLAGVYIQKTKKNQKYNEGCMPTQKTFKEQELVLALVQCSQSWTDEHSLHRRGSDTFGLIWCLHIVFFFLEDWWSAEFESRKADTYFLQYSDEKMNYRKFGTIDNAVLILVWSFFSLGSKYVLSFYYVCSQLSIA